MIYRKPSSAKIAFSHMGYERAKLRGKTIKRAKNSAERYDRCFIILS
jgi:hypothetical protein